MTSFNEGKMNESFEEKIKRYCEKNKENEAYLRSLGDTQVTYTPEQITALVKAGLLSKELGDWFFKNHEELQRKHNEMKEFRKNNPNATDEEFISRFFKEGALSIEETVKMHEDASMSTQLLVNLIQNKEFLSTSSLSEKINKTLFDKIDIQEDIGIVRALSDSLYHLEKILMEMTLTNLYENTYVAKGNFDNSKGESITLEYTFQASSHGEAESILKDYKNIMLKKGLRTWMAYWCSANEVGRVEYTVPLVDVMKWTASEEREAYFSQKEKEEFWSLTKILGMTKLSRTKVRRKRGSGREYVQWIEQPLIDIYGGERLAENDDKYPESVAVRVLMPRMGKNSFVPALYKPATLKLNPNDIYLAFIVQTRANQMGRGSRELFFDWEYLFEIGNLQQTAVSNTRMAKAKMRQKMDKLKDGDIIERAEEQLIGMSVQPKKAKNIK